MPLIVTTVKGAGFRALHSNHHGDVHALHIMSYAAFQAGKTESGSGCLSIFPLRPTSITIGWFTCRARI